MNNNTLPILMTASVATRGMKNACFTDEEREDMYIKTINFYIENLLKLSSDYRIVFVENSGWKLHTIQYNTIQYNEQLKQQVEFISLSPDLFDIDKGKGYNELLLINMAIRQSKFIQQSQAFFKVTGRYPIRNIKYFVDYGSKLIFKYKQDLYIDIKDHKLYDLLKLGWNGHSADVRMFATTTDFYENNIGNRYKELNDFEGRLMEGLMFDVVKTNQNIRKIICRFKKEPFYDGLEGSNVNAVIFSKNQNSVKGKLKRFAGNFIRIFIPWFWF